MDGLAANADTLGDDRRFFVFFGMLGGTAVGLLLARGVARQREFATRRGLGANRVQVAGQLFAEALVLVAWHCSGSAD